MRLQILFLSWKDSSEGNISKRLVRNKEKSCFMLINFCDFLFLKCKKAKFDISYEAVYVWFGFKCYRQFHVENRVSIIFPDDYISKHFTSYISQVFKTV